LRIGHTSLALGQYAGSQPRREAVEAAVYVGKKEERVF